jgi:urease accessory protein
MDAHVGQEPWSASLDGGALYRLLIWLSPAYPVGAFAYSSGIEWAVQAGYINDATTLQRWLGGVLTFGSGASDAIFFAQCHRAVSCANDAVVAELAELAAAFVTSRERYLETTTIGRAFVEVTAAAWPCPALTRLREHWRGPIAYPIAVGAAAAGHNIPLSASLQAFITAQVLNWVSAGARLIPLGHTDCQRLLNAMELAISEAVRRAVDADIDDLGNATFRADVANAMHETQYTRLFRS